MDKWTFLTQSAFQQPASVESHTVAPDWSNSFLCCSEDDLAASPVALLLIRNSFQSLSEMFSDVTPVLGRNRFMD